MPSMASPVSKDSAQYNRDLAILSDVIPGIRTLIKDTDATDALLSSIKDHVKSERLLIAMVFAKAPGMKLVAEGVETKVQAEFCTQHGCDLLQGYYYPGKIS